MVFMCFVVNGLFVYFLANILLYRKLLVKINKMIKNFNEFLTSKHAIM